MEKIGSFSSVHLEHFNEEIGMNNKIQQYFSYVISFIIFMFFIQPVQAASFENQSRSTPQISLTQNLSKNDRTIGVCHLVNSLDNISKRNPLSPIYGINPAITVRDYLEVKENKFYGYEIKIRVTQLNAPEHGTFEMGTTGGRYRPNLDFIGSDHISFLVEIDNLKIKAEYNFKVINGGAIGGTEQYDKKNCPNGMYWKISQVGNTTENVLIIDTNHLNNIDYLPTVDAKMWIAKNGND